MMALGTDRLIPGGQWLSTLSASGEPRRAMFVTGLLVLGALLLRDLNVIAPLITMFFLITYAVINLVTLVESTLSLVSFRPTLKLPRIVPFAGVVGCTFSMFIVNPSFSLVAWGVVLAIYVYILKRGVNRPTDDVRSGLFVAFAEWAAGKVTALIMETVRGWKPNMLVPVSDPSELRGEFRLLEALVRPEGSIKLLGLATDDTVAYVTRRISAMGQQYRGRDVFTTWSIIDSAGYTEGIVTGLQALKSAFFRPNLLIMAVSNDVGKDVELQTVVKEAKRLGVGVGVLGMHSKAGTGREQVVNLWVRPPVHGVAVEEAMKLTNLNLAILLAYRLSRAWRAQLNLISVVADESERAGRAGLLGGAPRAVPDPPRCTLRDDGGQLSRVPRRGAPVGHVLGLPRESERQVRFVREVVEASRSSCIFTQDSGRRARSSSRM